MARWEPRIASNPAWRTEFQRRWGRSSSAERLTTGSPIGPRLSGLDDRASWLCAGGHRIVDVLSARTIVKSGGLGVILVLF